LRRLLTSDASRFRSRRLLILTLTVGFAWAASAAAHDFWIQPNAFWVSPRAVTAVTLLVGHGPARQRSPITARRVTRFEAVAPDGARVDLRGGLHLGGPTADGDVRLSAPGTYVLVLETDDRAESHLPAIRYNDYLKVEGLTPALALRARTHRSQADGSENYGRRAKAILQVGPPGTGSQAQVTRPLGLSLEIVPDRSPYAVPRPATLPVHVFFEGHPLAGGLVKLTNLDHDWAPLESHVTDQAGRASFVMPKSGNWLLNVIWTKPLPQSRATDYETTFSSLSFGFPPGVP
jgi:uncharacterized GH25 family protein